MAINSRQQIPEFSGPYLPPARSPIHSQTVLLYRTGCTEIQPVAPLPSARWHWPGKKHSSESTTFPAFHLSSYPDHIGVKDQKEKEKSNQQENKRNWIGPTLFGDTRTRRRWSCGLRFVLSLRAQCLFRRRVVLPAQVSSGNEWTGFVSGGMAEP
jgi:hypothetical protein